MAKPKRNSAKPSSPATAANRSKPTPKSNSAKASASAKGSQKSKPSPQKSGTRTAAPTRPNSQKKSAPSAKSKSAVKNIAAPKGKPASRSATPQKSAPPAKRGSSTKAMLSKRAQSVSSSVTKAMSQAMSKVGSQAKKAAKAAEETDFRGGARKVGGAIASATRNLTTKLHLTKGDAAKASSKTVPAKAPAAKTPPKGAAPKPAPAAPRVTKRATDVALDDLAQNYTPGHTSLKSSFREGGVASTKDQEMSGGFSDDRWNDEDHYTNKSGDPRIGTHGRTYEPTETPKSRK